MKNEELSREASLWTLKFAIRVQTRRQHFRHKVDHDPSCTRVARDKGGRDLVERTSEFYFVSV